jgi:hypothetical protein
VQYALFLLIKKKIKPCFTKLKLFELYERQKKKKKKEEERNNKRDNKRKNKEERKKVTTKERIRKKE